MPLAMLPTKIRQHCQEQMIWANIVLRLQKNLSVTHHFIIILTTVHMQGCVEIMLDSLLMLWSWFFGYSRHSGWQVSGLKLSCGLSIYKYASKWTTQPSSFSVLSSHPRVLKGVPCTTISFRRRVHKFIIEHLPFMVGGLWDHTGPLFGNNISGYI